MAMPDTEKKLNSAQNPATPSAPAAPIAVKPVKVIHEKGSQFRTFHADGAWGIVNSFGNLQVDFCVERPPTPTAVLQPIKDGNFTGEQIMQGVDDPDYFLIVRDFQCGVILSYAAAVQVHTLLENYIKSVKQQMDSTLAQVKQQK
jgi:hypothetical protein